MTLCWGADGKAHSSDTYHIFLTHLSFSCREQGIALSGYGSEEDVERSRAAGFDIHLTKPVQFAALSAAIHQLFPASDKRC